MPICLYNYICTEIDSETLYTVRFNDEELKETQKSMKSNTIHVSA